MQQLSTGEPTLGKSVLRLMVRGERAGSLQARAFHEVRVVAAAPQAVVREQQRLLREQQGCVQSIRI